VGDIHGCAHLLELRLEQIYRDSQSFDGDIYQIFLGDYIDRGPDSLKVLQLLFSAPRHDHRRVCLMGNHEVTLLSCLTDARHIENWINFGAAEALLSFGLDPQLMHSEAGRAQLQQQIHQVLGATPGLLTFLETLPTFFEMDDYYCVHAGIRPGLPLAQQKDEDRLWIRQEFLTYTKPHPKMIIHGHTPCDAVEIYSNRINLDTGAYASGQLSCLVLEGKTRRFL
jgi:serine/threonine protein phosphatase 1